MSVVASSLPIRLKKIFGFSVSSSFDFNEQGKLRFKPSLSASKSDMFGGSVSMDCRENNRVNGRRRMLVTHVVSPNVVSNSSSS